MPQAPSLVVFDSDETSIDASMDAIVPADAAPQPRPAPSAAAAGEDGPITFDPAWIDDILFVPTRVSKHSLTNRWLPVDETAHFELVMKERKAVTTQQCRILVKGAPHLPLQVSAGPSVQFLFPTWQYLKLLESSGGIPDVARERYSEVEQWMEQHIRDFGQMRAATAKASTAAAAVDAPASQQRSTAAAAADAPPANNRSATPTAREVTTPANNANGSGVKDRLKGVWNSLRKSPSQPGGLSTPQHGAATPTAALDDGGTSPRGHVDPAVGGRSGDGDAALEGSVLTPEHAPAPTPTSAVVPTPAATGDHSGGAGAMGATSKRDAVRDFLRRKLHRPSPAGGGDKTSGAAAGNIQKLVKSSAAASSSEDDDDEGGVAADAADWAPPSLVACESLDEFRLTWRTLRRIVEEARHKDDNGHRVHETLDRLYRRRRAVNKWQYEHREEIFLRIKANRTVTIMVLVGIYSFLMHVVPFDLFFLLLVLLEAMVYFLATNYRDLAVTMGRRAARTRVDRVKDWFYFGLTRRKVRADAPGAHLDLIDD